MATCSPTINSVLGDHAGVRHDHPGVPCELADVLRNHVGVRRELGNVP